MHQTIEHRRALRAHRPPAPELPDHLRAARGILIGMMIGAASWAFIFLAIYWVYP